MVKIYLSTLLLCFFTSAFAQSPADKITGALQSRISSVSENNEILVWVYFTDKGNNTDIYFNDPQLVVSEKSINRREKVLGKSSPLTMKDIPVKRSYIVQVESEGLKLKHQSKWLNAVSGTIHKDQVNKIASLPFVNKLDIVYKLKKENPPETDLNKVQQPVNKTQQPGGIHSFDYGNSYDEMQQINVPAVHDLGYTGQGVTICVMDAGFSRLSHIAFNSMNIIAAWDFVNNDPNVGNQADSGNGSHGTETLSTIGGYAPGNLIGPAFSANYILAKTENTDSETPIEEDNWVAAMEWADSIGVDVTSTSLSYLTFDPPWPSYTWLDMDGNTTIITNAADYAAHLGIVVVNSAGNEGYNASHNTLGAPADGDSVITAGAVNYSGIRSSFSSVGPTVDGRIKPDIMALGSGNIVASPSNDNTFTSASGTSFSCPLSAGVAALVLCANPNLTPMQVREAMRNTASLNSNPDNLYGWGILNALDAVNYFPPTPTTFQLSVDVVNGWNMVSAPGINPDGQGVNIWWPGMDPSSSVYKYNDGYTDVTEVVPGEGYWMRNLGAQTYNTGDEWPAAGIQIAPHDPIPIHTGYNLISVYECPVSAADLTTTPAGIIIYPLYGYSSGYFTVNTLYPGYSYWLKAGADGFLNIPPCTVYKVTRKSLDNLMDNLPIVQAAGGNIILTDAAGRSYTLYAVNGGVDLNQFELPPLPPTGSFDIRFSSGRIAEDINNVFKTIEMRGVTYPVRVKVENLNIKLQDVTGNEINKNLKPGEEISINNPDIDKLMVSGEIIPDSYSLEQNYPNPFNPSTTIEFSLPENVKNVRLSVYNVLGEKVAELVNGSLTAGKYQYQWSGKNFASGIYIYELQTDEFVSIKKMILMK